MTARIYRVTATVLREDFKRAHVNVYHVAATNRAAAIREVHKTLYTNGADAISIVARSLGSRVRTEYRLLMEKQ